MACVPTVTVQSQICGALTFSSMISHLPASKKTTLASNQNLTRTLSESVSTFVWC